MQRVMRGLGDRLYLVGGSNEVLRLYDEAGFTANVNVEAWHARLAARHAFFAAAGIPWCQVLAPEKLSIDGDALLTAEIGPAALPPGQRLVERLNHPALVYPRPWLRRQLAAGHEMYADTDSHWTPVGALAAFQWLMRHLGMAVDYAPYLALESETLEYHGDLWEPHFTDIPPGRFIRKRIPAHVERLHANPIVRAKERLGLPNDMGLHVGSHVAYRNAHAERPERLLLFGSSFSDHRAECGLLTFLAALHFREVHFVWSADLDLDLIGRIAPDVAVVEMPERFLTTCPADQFDLAAHVAKVLERRGLEPG